MIRKWKPWEKSTGPKTPEGKEAMKKNAEKHGAYCKEIRELKKMIRQCDRDFKTLMGKIDEWRKHGVWHF